MTDLNPSAADLSRVHDAEATPRPLLVAQLDTTERKRVDEELVNRAAHLAVCVEYCPAAVAVLDRDMRYLAVSRRWCTDFSVPYPLTGRCHYEVFPEVPERWKAVHRRCLAGAVERCEDDPFPRADGSLDWVDWEVRPWFSAGGAIGGIVVLSQQVTYKKHIELQALRERETRMQRLVDAVPHLIAILDPDLCVDYANKAWRAYFGDNARWTSAAERIEIVHPGERAAANALHERAHTLVANQTNPAQSSSVGPILMRMRAHDGSYRWFKVRGTLLYEKPTSIILTATDVDALKSSQDSLFEAQARLQAAMRVGGIGTLLWEVGVQRVQWDESLLRVLGRTRQELESRSFVEILGLVHCDDRNSVRDVLTQAFEQGDHFELECRVTRPDGALISLVVRGRVERNAHNKPVRMIAAIVDVTHHKQLEGELLQSQKMEAIGQLAGGVAHDFNNLLTIILGHLSVLKMDRGLSSGVLDSLQDIDTAANRAATLTRQLLAFGRRQLMQTRDVDINPEIAATINMLRRIVGEGVSLEFEPCSNPLYAHVDTAMLSQVLLNLTVNARDAMERSGRCTLCTSIEKLDEPTAATIRGASAGHWACVCVSDTGGGIAPEVLPHLFEPFFTTKAVGRGTGLGLSTVYGILKQHGGFVTVHSVLGEGTTFRLFWPLARAASVAPSAVEATADRAPATGKILLVEDEPAVRQLMHTSLERIGHRVIDAENAPQALRVWQEHGGDFDLLLTDMMMPGNLTGLDLIDLLRAERPNLPAILCSGYSLDFATGETEREQLTLLQKPWTAEKLRRVVDEVLAAAHESAAR